MENIIPQEVIDHILLTEGDEIKRDIKTSKKFLKTKNLLGGNLSNAQIKQVIENKEESEKLKQKNKFERFILKITEYLKLIKYWFIAEYRIVQRLGYAFNRKNDELKVRHKFFNTKRGMVNKYGYEDGIEKFNKFSKNMSRSIDISKSVSVK